MQLIVNQKYIVSPRCGERPFSRILFYRYGTATRWKGK